MHALDDDAQKLFLGLVARATVDAFTAAAAARLAATTTTTTVATGYDE